MRKMLHIIFPYICIIFILCVAIYYVMFYIENPEQTNVSQKQTEQIESQADASSTEPQVQNTEDSNVLPSESPTNELSQEEDATSDTELSVEATTPPMNREALRLLPAGTIIDIKEVGATIMENCFYHEDINNEIKLRIVGNSYKDNCTVPFEDLNYVRILYYGFDEETHIGELIVNTAIAEDIVSIFAELYESKYPIERMVLIDEYKADDNVSMAANNTSSFNFRPVPGSTHLSKHALGLAIDVNPLYNPYVQYNENETIILPKEGTAYVDRTLDCPYYINEDDLCYQAFIKRGFTWGGFWETEPDYQHFQKTLE